MVESKALVTSCNRLFIPGAQALLKSARRHHPDVRRYCYVPPADMEEARRRLDGLAEIRPCILNYDSLPDALQMWFARVLVCEVEENVAAYVDADALFCRPAPELWQVDCGMVNAVEDESGCVSDVLEGEAKQAFEAQFPHVASRKGFNTGVFALRPAEWRDLPIRVKKALTTAPYKTAYRTAKRALDQPILNALMADRVRHLPAVYNVHCLFDNPISSDVRILHFTSMPKPWMKGFRAHEPAYWFWLKHGLPQAGPVRLFFASLWIAIVTPKRLVGRKWRSARRLCRLWDLARISGSRKSPPE